MIPLESAEDRRVDGRGPSRAAVVVLALLLPPSAIEARGQPTEGTAERGVAILAAKVLTCELRGRQVVDDGIVLVKEGRIEAVGSRHDVEIPAGYEKLDVGERWLCPGFIDLHSHIAGELGINDMVLQVNPGLRVSPTVIPDNAAFKVAIAAGVTTVLYIPGSGTNIGGQGILLKTAPGDYADVVVRDPGSLKIAQGDNPTRFAYGMGRILMNFHIRTTLRRGLAYAKRWEAYEAGEGPRPDRQLDLDVFRPLYKRTTQISTHTQYYQVVLATLDILGREFPFDAYIDHGSFDSWKLGAIAEEIGVPAILGPREVHWPSPPRFDTDGRVEGTAWGFQKMGTSMIGFNTDAPVVPQEELPLQSAMGVRYGFDNEHLGAVRGLTIVPAKVAGIDERVGSISVGKDADLLVLTGDPSDPRCAVDLVLVNGEVAYDSRDGGRRW